MNMQEDVSETTFLFVDISGKTVYSVFSCVVLRCDQVQKWLMLNQLQLLGMGYAQFDVCWNFHLTTFELHMPW